MTLKMTFIDIAAKNVEEKIIHSNLHINFQDNFDHESLISNIFRTENSLNDLKKIRVLIIDEIFMINNQMLSFVSELFVRLHKNSFSFEDFHVIVFDDLLQLSSIRNRQIFHSFV